MRYKVLDACFRNRQKRYYKEDLLEAVNEYLERHGGKAIQERQLWKDITFMEIDADEDIVLDRIQDGHSKYFRYRRADMSIFKHELTDEEVRVVSHTVKLLSRFEGLPRYAWVEETLLHLREHFQIDEKIAGAVSFAQNPDLTGLEWFKPLFEAIEEKRVVELTYHRFGKKSRKRTVHPYQLKQWNYRWYLVGMEEEKLPRLPVVVIPIDRIDEVSTVSSVRFQEKDPELDLDDYFYDIVGVSRLPEGKVETVRVKAYYPAAHYMETKPIHASQREVHDEGFMVQGSWTSQATKSSAMFKVFEWRVVPNEELVQALMVYGDQVEVMEGEWVRRKMCERAKAILGLNENEDENDKKTSRI